MTAICFYTGASTLVILGAFAIYCIAEFTREGIVNLRWHYKYKHRFDKKPIAKCYCIDCEYHGKGNNNNLCLLHNRYFSNDWFCKDAEPKDKEQHDG